MSSKQRTKKRWSAHFPIPSDETTHKLYGIKRLSYENFLVPCVGAMLFDPYGGLITEGLPIPTAAAVRARVERFTAVNVRDDVPETVWRMFEVAKGAMAFGLFFYPLYTIGEDHLSRLFEWMVKDRYVALSGKNKASGLKVALDWLLKHGHFPPGSEVRWRAAYHIRNLKAHPTMQYIMSPADASRNLHYMRELIEHLYPEPVLTT